MQVLWGHTEAEVPVASDRVPDLPAPLVAAARRGMAKIRRIGSRTQRRCARP
jgi:hypothetical protein